MDFFSHLYGVTNVPSSSWTVRPKPQVQPPHFKGRYGDHVCGDCGRASAGWGAGGGGPLRPPVFSPEAIMKEVLTSLCSSSGVGSV